MLIGAGQYGIENYRYFNADVGTPAAIYMAYVDLATDVPGVMAKLKSDLESESSDLIIPHIGLAMNRWQAKYHYEDKVAAGAYDAQIRQFTDGLVALNRPAYVRIGFEFNASWNGYESSAYVKAYKRIADAIRNRKLNNVALVWNYSPADPKDYWPWYPGDEYVDWWGINLFYVADFTSNTSQWFMRDSMQHRKPVMIGEASPSPINIAGAGIVPWYSWYAPFFGFISHYPNIKQFNYININWGSYPEWPTWGDARIGTNPQIASSVGIQLADPFFLHRESAGSLLSKLHRY